LNGIQEVVGSIPSSSTNEFKDLEGFPSKSFFVGYTKINTNDVWWMDGSWFLEEGSIGMVFL